MHLLCVSLCVHCLCMQAFCSSHLCVLCAMSRVWADPRCPTLEPDGSPPSWLVLRAYDGVSRQLYCALCDQWAEGSHLHGRRHLRNVWYFNDRRSAVALTSSAASCAAGGCHSAWAVPLLAIESATSCSVSLGSDVPEGGTPDGAASEFLEDRRSHAPWCRITSLAQIDSSVVEELIASVLARLHFDASG